MRKRDEFELTKHTLNLYRGDYAKLQALYPLRLGAGKIIRDLVRAHIKLIEETAQQRIPPRNLRDIESELAL